MLTDIMDIRPRYGEVDRMGYVYHANYVSYCHQARTEMLRKLGINDKVLEDKNVMMPVISFEINYLKPSFYDELLKVKTVVKEKPEVRFNFEFEIHNEKDELVTKAKSTVVFVDAETRFPQGMPTFVEEVLTVYFKPHKL